MTTSIHSIDNAANGGVAAAAIAPLGVTAKRLSLETDVAAFNKALQALFAQVGVWVHARKAELVAYGSQQA